MIASGQFRGEENVDLNVSTVQEVQSLGLGRTGEMILAHIVSLKQDVLDLRLRMDERLRMIELRLDNMGAVSSVEGDVDDPEEGEGEEASVGGRRSLTTGEVGSGDHVGRAVRGSYQPAIARRRQENDHDRQDSDYDVQESDYYGQGSDYDERESEGAEQDSSVPWTGRRRGRGERGTLYD